MEGSFQLMLIGIALIVPHTLCQGPNSVPSCCDLKKMEPSVQCDVNCDGGGLERSFGAATFGGGNFIGGFSGKFIYDVFCNQWRSVGYRECPVAYEMNSYRNFCNNYGLTAHLDHPRDVAAVYVLDLLGGGLKTCQFTPVCVGCPGLGMCNGGGNHWSPFLTRSGRSVESNEEEIIQDLLEDVHDTESVCDPNDSEFILEVKDVEEYDADYDDEEGDDFSEREMRSGPGSGHCRRCRWRCRRCRRRCRQLPPPCPCQCNCPCQG